MCLARFFAQEGGEVENCGFVHERLATLGWQELRRFQIMETVRHFDEEHEGEPCIGRNELRKIGLLAILSAFAHGLRRSGKGLHGIGDIITEGGSDIRNAHRAVFRSIMEERGDIRRVRQINAGCKEELQYGERMRNKSATVQAQLSAVRPLGESNGIAEGEEALHGEGDGRKQLGATQVDVTRQECVGLGPVVACVIDH